MPIRLLEVVTGRVTSGVIEVRCLPLGKDGVPPFQGWYPLDRLDAAVHTIGYQSQQKGLDVYVGAALRARRGGGADAVDEAWALWADCDTPAAVERLAGWIEPTLTIRSGSGSNVHAWWSLEAPVPVRNLSRALKRIQHHLGADVASTDPARIMRAPGTLNFKADPPGRVEVVSHDPFFNVYSLRDLVGGLADPQPPKPKRNVRPSAASANDPLKAIPAETYYQRLTGMEPTRGKGGRVRCPFWDHQSNPAMALYDDCGFHCFACPASGTVYDFAARLWGVTSTTGDDFLRLRERLLDELGVSG